MRKVAAFLFGYLGPKRQEFKALEEEWAAGRAAGKNDRELGM